MFVMPWDHLSVGNSRVHRMPASVKLGFACSGVVGLSLLPGTYAWVFAAYLAVLTLVVAVAGVSPKALLRRMLWLEPMALGMAGLAFLQPDGLRVFLLIVVKSTLCLATLILLSATTSFGSTLQVLTELRFPRLLLITVALMYRYLFVLVQELERMRRARACRTFSRHRRWSWMNAASLIGQLFLRSSERAERIYGAMCARGWK
jgi:cobalt/nickel transport system permease protein